MTAPQISSTSLREAPRPAGDRSRTPSRDDKRQEENNAAGNDTRARSTSRSRSGKRVASRSRSRSRSQSRGPQPAQQHNQQGQTSTTRPPALKSTCAQMSVTSVDCEISPAASGTTGSDVCSTQRSSSTSQEQASIADMVDEALEQKFSAFTATITHSIEQSIFSHVSALEARNTQRFHELKAPNITQMESIMAKYNRQISQLNEGKHTKGVKQLSGRRYMPATALHINLDSDDASTTQHDG
ncbi:hypothetical protein HPB52_005495 [Rhipicephalus sanguineus]|uniref:Uncharacterized protein n=1 Tax=Rhipicephalus sanguineus TaxID=34632 RepID=A0A9D4QHG8_RHISA|nr:hypothetical protein HPB52_005495 [Rhipicephalus sanguineus]